MDGLSISRDDMSVDWCSVYCEDYKYFGTEGVTCFCDNIIPPSTATNCDLSCEFASALKQRNPCCYYHALSY